MQLQGKDLDKYCIGYGILVGDTYYLVKDVEQHLGLLEEVLGADVYTGEKGWMYYSAEEVVKLEKFYSDPSETYEYKLIIKDGKYFIELYNLNEEFVREVDLLHALCIKNPLHNQKCIELLEWHNNLYNPDDFESQPHLYGTDSKFQWSDKLFVETEYGYKTMYPGIPWLDNEPIVFVVERTECIGSKRTKTTYQYYSSIKLEDL